MLRSMDPGEADAYSTQYDDPHGSIQPSQGRAALYDKLRTRYHFKIMTCLTCVPHIIASKTN